ncbi:lytic transglycosylase domain-containing protein [Actinokineospora diospyrosa]|uniref:Membrane-bound lytic murein transglycosylase B n=1 Tax=Actinokineospora diospyrosa TaxID=103728 RepID=A0ABT1IG64_9PSEU|nr:lytic transglycosylase domain-containing protein [Actinokineospora diospyrosa]MCP2271643.1 Membrane-bound lytic murein transglycosylase B [Actinokineospora diospyrosa]
MGLKTGGRKAGKHRQQSKRRRGAAAAAGALLFVPVVAAGEPVDLAGADTASEVALAKGIGGGLFGLTDPSEVGADGSAPENAELGKQILALAGTPELLKYTAGPAVTVPGGPNGIPGTMLQAYMRAAQTMATTTPGCHLDWPLLASIGRIESNHARGGQVDASGKTAHPILGPVLNGGGFAAISDTDGGRYDGDARWDRAVGPMQFIPSTWKGYASDGNADGQTDPNNIYDATLGAGKYLCSGGLDLANAQHRATAVFRYNHSDSYVRTVLIWADAYAKGVTPLPSTPVDRTDQLAIPAPITPTPQGTLPPVDGVAPTQPPSTPPAITTTPPGSSVPSTTTTTTTTTTVPSTTTTTPDPTTTTTTTPTCVDPTTTTPTPTPTTTTTPDPCAPATPAVTPTGAAGSSVVPTP